MSKLLIEGLKQICLV